MSLALGAFVAGMLVAETGVPPPVETDIQPFHDVLLGLFFITIGMKLDWRPVIAEWPLVLMLTLAPVLAKFVLVAGLARLFWRAAGRGAAHRPLSRRRPASSASCCCRWARATSWSTRAG